MKSLHIIVAVVAITAGVSGCFGPSASERALEQAWRERLAVAEAMFQERCRKAGVKI